MANTRRAAIRSATMLGSPGDEAIDLPVFPIETEEDNCERLLERRERWGFSNVVVPGESMAVCAPSFSASGTLMRRGHILMHCDGPPRWRLLLKFRRRVCIACGN